MKAPSTVIQPVHALLQAKTDRKKQFVGKFQNMTSTVQASR